LHDVVGGPRTHGDQKPDALEHGVGAVERTATVGAPFVSGVAGAHQDASFRAEPRNCRASSRAIAVRRWGSDARSRKRRQGRWPWATSPPPELKKREAGGPSGVPDGGGEGGALTHRSSSSPTSRAPGNTSNTSVMPAPGVFSSPPRSRTGSSEPL